MRLLATVPNSTVGTGQDGVWHSIWFTLVRPLLIPRSVTLRVRLFQSQLWVANTFHFGVEPVLTPAPSLGNEPGMPVSVVKLNTRVASARAVKLPGIPNRPMFH